jgi:hypothetical protein
MPVLVDFVYLNPGEYEGNRIQMIHCQRATPLDRARLQRFRDQSDLISHNDVKASFCLLPHDK